MYCYLSAVTNEEIDQLLSNPESIEEFIHEVYELEDYLDLEKSWDGVHFPSIWDRESKNNREWLLMNINELRKFLSQATEHNSGMLVWLQ